ncbi:MAG: glycosyltransferase family 2 protein [Methanomassiliicoccales archaeon]
MERAQIRTVAVIPAYNEQKTIGSIVLKAKLNVDEVLVVDDGSVDDTALLAEMAGAKVLRMPHNSGKAEALMSGLRYVAGNGFEAVVMLDGDGQHDPSAIPDLIKPILEGSADLIIGSRFLNGGDGIPRYRKLGQTILNKTTSFGAKVKVTDTQSGFRALSRNAMRHLDFEADGYGIESAMITYMAERGLRIAEVPINADYEVPNGHKKKPLPHGMGVLNAAVGLIGYRRPLLLFGVPGFFMALMGMIFGLLAMNGVFVFGWGWLFQSVGAMMFVIVGLMLMIAGLTLNSLVALMRSCRNKI